MYTKIFTSAFLLSSIFIYPAAEQLHRSPGKQPAAAQGIEFADASEGIDKRWEKFMNERVELFCASTLAHFDGGAAAEKGPSVDSSDDAVEMIDVACADGSLSLEQAAGAAQAVDTQREQQLWQIMNNYRCYYWECSENNEYFKRYEGINPDYAYKGITLLELALKHGDRQLVAFLCERGADINAFNAEGQLPIHIALRHGNISGYEYLIKRGAKLGDLHDLLLAAAESGFDTLQRIRASLNIGTQLLTPAVCAKAVAKRWSEYRRLDALNYFHSKAPKALAQSCALVILAGHYYSEMYAFGSKSGFERLAEGRGMIADGLAERIRWLLINCPLMVYNADHFGNTVLHYLWCDEDLLKWALKNGAACHINAQNNVGDTSIMHMLKEAAPGSRYPSYQKDLLPALKQFFKHGARISYVDQKNNHALFAKHPADIIQKCLERDEADPNWINAVGDSDNPRAPIWFSVTGLKELKAFENARADMSARNGHGVPYLLYAVKRAPRDVVNYMLANYPDQWRNEDGSLVVDNHGNTVFHMLAQRCADGDANLGLGHKLVLSLKSKVSDDSDYMLESDALEQKRVKSIAKLAQLFASYNPKGVNKPNNDGNTPLHVACGGYFISLACIKALLLIGAVPHALNQAGQMPIDRVSWAGDLELFDLLDVKNTHDYLQRWADNRKQEEAERNKVGTARLQQAAAAQKGRRDLAIARFHAAEKARQ